MQKTENFDVAKCSKVIEKFSKIIIIIVINIIINIIYKDIYYLVN